MSGKDEQTARIVESLELFDFNEDSFDEFCDIFEDRDMAEFI
jgi:hypothetical protein